MFKDLRDKFGHSIEASSVFFNNLWPLHQLPLFPPHAYGWASNQGFEDGRHHVTVCILRDIYVEDENNLSHFV